MIHNISIATDDDVIQLGDDENIYQVYLSRKDHCFRSYFLKKKICKLIWELTYGH